MTIEFWITSIIVTATPGTGALFTVAAGLNRGIRAGLIAAVGCTLGIIPHLVLALSGAAAVFAASPVAFGVLKWLGVAYLLYMAWGTWRQTGVLAPDTDEADGADECADDGAVFREGDRKRCSRESAQPEAHRVLLRLPAPVR